MHPWRAVFSGTLFDWRTVFYQQDGAFDLFTKSPELNEITRGFGLGTLGKTQFEI
jgi:hypothetical protein